MDKILGMKPAKNGGISYQILWQDGSKPWEPEDNADDEFVDEFEEQAQAEAYKGDAINVAPRSRKAIVDGFENRGAQQSLRPAPSSSLSTSTHRIHCLASTPPHHHRVSLPSPACMQRRAVA